MSRKPFIVNGNKYYFLGDDTRLCVSCGFPIMNNKSAHGKACRKQNPVDRNDLTPCEKTKNAGIALRNRARWKEEGISYAEDTKKREPTTNAVEGKRICLRCDNMFNSLSVHNRLCPRCTRIPAGHDIHAFNKIDAPGSDRKYQEPLEATWNTGHYIGV